MPLLTRRRLLIAVLVLVLLWVAVAVFLLTRGQDLKSRAALITVGMPREQVEEILGPPAITLLRTGGRGTLMSWVDQLWQVDVLTGPDGLVESINYTPSDSVYRRMERRLLSPRK